MIIHIAKENESLYDIAKEYSISPIMLGSINGILPTSRLYKNEEILVLIPTKTYCVKANDTLYSIANRFNVDEKELIAINPELLGRASLYEGQTLSIKYDSPRFGTAVTNGYCYPRCPINSLKEKLPYMSMATVSLLQFKDGRLDFLMNDRDYLEIINQNKRPALMRVYTEELLDENTTKEMTEAIIPIAQKRGYSGITLAMPKASKDKISASKIILNMKKRLMEKDLWLIVEADAEKDLDYTEYSDAVILYYDKLHKDTIPNFSEAEGKILKDFAKKHESTRTLVDLSCFAYYNNRYITKDEARKILLKTKNEISLNNQTLIISCDKAGRKKEALLCESLKHTEEKLKAVSECAYMGVSFDVARTPIKELLALRSMFNIAYEPYMLEGREPCNS